MEHEMSLLLEGWDAYGDISRMGGRWAMNGTNSLRPALRGGGQAYQCRSPSSTGAPGPSRLLGGTTNHPVIHLDMLREGISSSVAWIIMELQNAGGSQVCRITAQNTDGDLSIRRASTILLNVSGAIPTGNPADSAHIEIDIEISTSADATIIVRRNGAIIGQVDNVQTALNAGPVARIVMGGTSSTLGAGVTIDNLYITDGVSAGPVIVSAVPFDSDVGTQDFVPDSGSVSTDRTKEVPDDGDTSTITSDTIGDVNTHGFDGTVLAGRTILAVQRLVCAKLSEAGTDEIEVAFAGQGSPDALPFSTDYLTRGGTILAQDPDTAAAWTPASLLAQEATLEHVTG